VRERVYYCVEAQLEGEGKKREENRKKKREGKENPERRKEP
jgi:hypothetical protein